MSTSIDNGCNNSNSTKSSFTGQGLHVKIINNRANVCPLVKPKSLQEISYGFGRDLNISEINACNLNKTQSNPQPLNTKSGNHDKVSGSVDLQNSQIQKIKSSSLFKKLLKENPGAEVKQLHDGGIKVGVMIGDQVLMTFRKDIASKYKQAIQLSVENHKKLVGKNCQNLNTVVSADQECIHLKSYGQHYQETVLMNKSKQVDGLERVYHMRDGLKGLKQLRQNGMKYHNDIKPNNIAVVNEKLILADFDTASNYLNLDDKGNPQTNDVQNIWQSVTCDINDEKLKMQATNGYTDKINRAFEKSYKQCTKNQDKLYSAKEIVEKSAQKQHQISQKQWKQGIYQQSKEGVQRMNGYVEQIQDVIVSDYRKQVNTQLICSGLTTVLNATRSYYNTKKNLKDKAKEDQTVTQKKIIKECQKAGVKQIAKGGLGMVGKLFQKQFTQKQIKKSFSNQNYRMGALEKCGISAAVEVGKQGIEYLFSDKKPNLQNLINSAKKILINSAEFGANQYLTTKIIKQFVNETVDTFANYSASTFGKNAATLIVKQAAEAGKTFLQKASSALTSSLKCNAIGACVGFAVGTVADICRKGKFTKSQFAESLKDNAIQSTGSLVGTAIGAAIGSVVPVIGTGVGGVLGGVVGSMCSGWVADKVAKTASKVKSWFSSWF